MNQKSTVESSTTSHPDDAVRALKTGVTDGAHDVAREMKHAAVDVAQEARKTAEAQLSNGKDRAAVGLGSVAEALRHTGEHLRADDQLGLTDYIVQAADKVEAASGYLQDRTLGQIVGDVEQFARREPALFLGGAFVLGLLGGRFLKSSQPEPRHLPRPGRVPDYVGPRYAKAGSPGAASASEGAHANSESTKLPGAG